MFAENPTVSGVTPDVGEAKNAGGWEEDAMVLSRVSRPPDSPTLSGDPLMEIEGANDGFMTKHVTRNPRAVEQNFIS